MTPQTWLLGENIETFIRCTGALSASDTKSVAYDRTKLRKCENLVV